MDPAVLIPICPFRFRPLGGHANKHNYSIVSANEGRFFTSGLFPEEGDRPKERELKNGHSRRFRAERRRMHTHGVKSLFLTMDVVSLRKERLCLPKASRPKVKDKDLTP